MIPEAPAKWHAFAPKANTGPRSPAPPPVHVEPSTLRQRLADTAKGRHGDGWKSMRLAAKGERMFRLAGGPGTDDLPLAHSADEYVTRQIVWSLAQEPEWFTVPAEEIGALFAPSLGILRQDAQGISESGARMDAQEIARKWAQAVQKTSAAHAEATEFADRLIAGIRKPDGDPAWRTGLITSGSAGKPTSGAANTMIVLNHHPEIAGRLAMDVRSSKILIHGDRGIPWDPHARGLWDDTHSTRCAGWIEQVAFFNPGSRLVHECVLAVARDNPIDPFRYFLEGLTWDGSPRLDTWLSRYAGAEQNRYHAAVGAAWLISAVARAFVPGSKVDTMLVLEGAQGAFKSTLLRVLAGDQYFTDQIPDITSKDAKDALQGPAIIEIAEMEALSRREVAAVKAFLTITVDRFRPAYGRSTEEKPRRCVFAGTTNPDGTGYLRDVTGGRRFWCVAAGRCDVEAMRVDRAQLWAEAVYRYRQGEPWWLDAETEVIAKVEQEARRDSDPWEELLAPLAKVRADENGRGAFRGVILPAESFDAEGRCVWITANAALQACGVEPNQRDRSKQMRVGQALRALGWMRSRKQTERGYSFSAN